jgi:UDPglucose 6-dehydrogenase
METHLGTFKGNCMKIVVAGYGYVGKAVEQALAHCCDIRIIDPAYNTNSIGDIDYDALIICVSTPQRDDGACDMQNVFDCIDQSNDKPILIKSTISIEGWQQLKQKYPNKGVTFSPEFLRAKTAIEDFNKQQVMYFSNDDCNDDWELWSKLFLNNNKNLKFKLASAEELILSKYFRNSFLATKVSFFNQMYDLCSKLDLNFDKVRECVADDMRIGESHSYVTNERGFGGHCFPKDTNALITTANNNEVGLSVIKEAVKYNNFWLRLNQTVKNNKVKDESRNNIFNI